MRSFVRPFGWLLVGVFLVWTVLGCMGPQTVPSRPARIEPGNYRTLQLNTSDYGAAFAAAQGAVMDHFQIASADPAAGVIQLAPSEYSRLGGTRYRRVGQVVLWNTGSYIVAAVQIQIEKYATPSIRAIQPAFGGDDRPGTTPIQQDAGLTPQQQDYWMAERRDTALEGQILNQIAAAIDQAKQSSGNRTAETRPAGHQP
jgi:hypothetical protein